MTFPLAASDILFNPLADSIVLCRLSLDCCWFGWHCTIELFYITISILDPNVVSLGCSFHDQKMFVQREWFSFVMRPSANILSQTVANTVNFSSLVSALPFAAVLITLNICALEVIIRPETPRCSNQLSPHILLLVLLVQHQNIHQLNAHGCHHRCRKDQELCYAFGGLLELRIMNARIMAMQTCTVAGWIVITFRS